MGSLKLQLSMKGQSCISIKVAAGAAVHGRSGAAHPVDDLWNPPLQEPAQRPDGDGTWDALLAEALQPRAVAAGQIL